MNNYSRFGRPVALRENEATAQSIIAMYSNISGMIVARRAVISNSPEIEFLRGVCPKFLWHARQCLFDDLIAVHVTFHVDDAVIERNETEAFGAYQPGDAHIIVAAKRLSELPLDDWKFAVFGVLAHEMYHHKQWVAGEELTERPAQKFSKEFVRYFLESIG